MHKEAERRRVLQGLLALVGAGVLPHRVLGADLAGAAGLFSDAEMEFITALADTLIPATDTLGAALAGVPLGFADLITEWASDERRTATQRTIAALHKDLNLRVGGSFSSGGTADRLKALEELDADAYGAERVKYGDYRDIKVLLLHLYYATKPGATQELRYDPIPGGYEGDVLFVNVGRTWAEVEG